MQNKFILVFSTADIRNICACASNYT